jgi:hypothetical protein
VLISREQKGGKRNEHLVAFLPGRVAWVVDCSAELDSENLRSPGGKRVIAFPEVKRVVRYWSFATEVDETDLCMMSILLRPKALICAKQ